MRRPAHRSSAIPNALALLGLTLLLTAACGGDDEASVDERLEEKGTMDLVEEVAQDEYDPPADGELSEAQMEMYVEVQERAIKIRQVAQKRMEERVGEDGEGGDGEGGKQPGLFDALRAVGDLGDLVTADLRAAKELGHNAAEYQWVREQVLAARMERMSRGMQAGFAAANQQVLEALEAQRAAAPDDATRQALDEQIAQYEESVAEAQAAADEEPGLDHNVELVGRYEERLQKLDERAAEAAQAAETAESAE